MADKTSDNPKIWKLVFGRTLAGVEVPIQVDANGKLVVTT